MNSPSPELSTGADVAPAVDAGAMADALKAQVERDALATFEQLDLMPDVDAVITARERLGVNAGQTSIVREAGRIMREGRGGRKPGSRNRRNIELRKFLLSHGTHPMVGAMKLQSMNPVELIEWSMEVDPGKRRMTLQEAIGLQMRAREFIGPYIESKQPVAMAVAFQNLPDLIIEGLTHSSDAVRTILDAEPLPFDEDDDWEPGE